MTMFDQFAKFPKKLSDARILVTNDDGINAPGLKVLERVAKSISKDVWVVAPETEQSGVSHSLTLHEPLRVRKIGVKRFAVSGTPTDCSLLATKVIVPRKKPVNLILSGVNRGANLAEDVTYSGTVAAAIEGTLLEVPSIAFSLHLAGDKEQWKTVEHFAPDIIAKLVKNKWPDNTLMNVNFPALPVEKIKGVRLAPLGRRKINEKITERLDPKGRAYYWIGGPLLDDYDREGVDLHQIAKGYITITPLCLDLTDYKVLEDLRGHYKK